MHVNVLKILKKNQLILLVNGNSCPWEPQIIQGVITIFFFTEKSVCNGKKDNFVDQNIQN